MKKNIKKKKPLKIVYEYVDTPDAEERISKAFDILFGDTLKKYYNSDD